VCLAGYFPGVLGACQRCSTSSDRWASLTLLVLALAAAAAACYLARPFQRISERARRRSRNMGKIIFVFLQVYGGTLDCLRHGSTALGHWFHLQRSYTQCHPVSPPPVPRYIYLVCRCHRGPSMRRRMGFATQILSAIPVTFNVNFPSPLAQLLTVLGFPALDMPVATFVGCVQGDI